ncbi:MAG: NUDIX domain-containing protein, partial [Clostridiales bacterium]|nr:NUDIX domain-containing protein [Clostridiales bacterium]
MGYEKSCGAVVWRRAARGREVLVIRQRAGHWGFPKGHVKPGETERQTALREIRE